MSHDRIPRFAYDPAFFDVRGQSVRARNIAEFLHFTGDKLTSYQLSKRFKATPQTITSSLLGFGGKYGVQYYDELHRVVKGENIYKRVWYCNEMS